MQNVVFCKYIIEFINLHTSACRDNLHVKCSVVYACTYVYIKLEQYFQTEV